MNWLIDLLTTPDAQPNDWYAWVTVLAAHALIVGGSIAAALMILRWPQWVGFLGYAVWEAAQLFFGGTWEDGLADAGAVFLGQTIIWSLWNGRRKVGASAFAIFLGLAAIGSWARRK